MRHKDIEAARELRLWIGQIIVPAATVIAFVPEARELVATKAKELKQKIDNKIKK